MKHRDRRILNRCFISKHFDFKVSFQNVPEIFCYDLKCCQKNVSLSFLDIHPYKCCRNVNTSHSQYFRHFSQAYEWLEEIRMIDNNCLEIKVVAGFLNYKMCKLMFGIGSPRDAITQFRTHIDKYRNRNGCKDLLFEHFAWLSVQ